MKSIFALGFALAVFPVFAAVPSADWQKVRDHQPAALHLSMTLPKDHFFQGEEIDATVTFANDDPAKKYQVEFCPVPWKVLFHAADDAGHAAPNPVEWYFKWYGIAYAGAVQVETLGTYSAPFPVNDTVRFEKPGVYHVYVQVTVIDGTIMNQRRQPFDIVSGPVTITIEPRSLEQEKATIADGEAKIAAPAPRDYRNPDPMEAGVREIGYLGSPAAADALLAYCGRDPGMTQDIFRSLVSMPDPAAVAAKMFGLVKAGKLTPSDLDADTYAILKTYSFVGQRDPRAISAADLQKYSSNVTARDAARQEVIDAALAATEGKGAAHVEALWTAFEEQAIHKNPNDPDRDGGAARAALAARQIELSQSHIDELLNAWTYWGSADFKPLLEREAATNPRALVALAGIDPQGQRDAIIKDFLSTYPRLLSEDSGTYEMLARAKPMPLPQFDSLFRAQLQRYGTHPVPIIAVISAYGSPALLPDVAKEYHAHNHPPENHWDVQVLVNLFHYWLRCDPEGGAAAMEKELEADQDGDNLFQMAFNEMWSGNAWNDSALPVVRWMLEHGKPNDAAGAVSLAQKHGDESFVDPVIAALKRVRADKEFAAYASSQAADVLKSSRWHFNARQKAALEALARAPGAK